MSPGSPGASHERPAGFAGRNGTRSPERKTAATQPHIQSSRTADNEIGTPAQKLVRAGH